MHDGADGRGHEGPNGPGGAEREPDVRIVRGEVVDPLGRPVAPASATESTERGAGGAGGGGGADASDATDSAAPSRTSSAGTGTVDGAGAAAGPGTVAGPDPWAGRGYGGYQRMEVRTFAMPRPPGGWVVWVGGGLVALGVYLVLAAAYPAVAAAGSAAVAVVGGLLLAYGASRRGGWAVYVGAVVLAGGLAGLGQAAGLLPGGGWTTLAIGIALLALAAYRARRGPGATPLAVFGAIMAVLGGVQAAGSVIPGFPSLGQLAVPVILGGVGLVVIIRALRRT